MAYDEGALSRAHHYLHMEGREQLTVAGVALVLLKSQNCVLCH